MRRADTDVERVGEMTPRSDPNERTEREGSRRGRLDLLLLVMRQGAVFLRREGPRSPHVTMHRRRLCPTF